MSRSIQNHQNGMEYSILHLSILSIDKCYTVYMTY